MPPPLLVTFAGGNTGPWRIEAVTAVRGEGLPVAGRLAMVEGSSPGGVSQAQWALRGVTSNLRYTLLNERLAMERTQEGLGRAAATCAVLILIRKNAAWWALAQDERRAIFKEQSRHIVIGQRYLPAIARRLHHARDLGEPFDFLTWFEFAP